MPNYSQYDYAFNWNNAFNSETVELRRETLTYDEDGADNIVEAKVADITVSFQPASETDLLNLPEGDREKNVFTIYSKYEDLRTEDILVRFNERYKIKSPPMPWYPTGVFHHSKSFAYEIENE